MSEHLLVFASELFADRAAEVAQVPIAVTGSWVKDGHRFSITEEDLSDIVRNFEKRGNGEVVVDFEHASERPEVARGGPVPAAGWIKALRVGRNGSGGSVLTAAVKFTNDARQLIADGKYRYFSPAIDWAAADKATGRGKGATRQELRRGGLREQFVARVGLASPPLHVPRLRRSRAPARGPVHNSACHRSP